MTVVSSRPPLADTLPFAADFMIELLATASRAPLGHLSWLEINRLAAQWLRPRPEDETSDTSRLGHAVVIEMDRHGLIDAELTTAADGSVMVNRVVHPRIDGLRAAHQLAA